MSDNPNLRILKYHGSIHSNEKPFTQTLKFIFKLLWDTPVAFFLLVILSILASLSELVGIALFIPLLESLTDASSSIDLPINFLSDWFTNLSIIETIRLVALVLIGVEICKQVLRYFCFLFGVKFEININKRMRLMVFDRLLYADIQSVKSDNIASLFTILNSYTGSTANAVRMIANAITNLFTSMASLLVLVTLSLPMTVITLVVAVTVQFGLAKLTRKIGRLSRDFNVLAVNLSHIGIEVLNGLMITRLFCREEATRKKFSHDVDELQAKMIGRGKLDAMIAPLSSLTVLAVIVCILVLGTFIFQQDTEYWVQTLILFLFVFSRLATPLGNLAQIRTTFVTSKPGIDTTIEFLEKSEIHKQDQGKEHFDKFERNIAFENLSFRYQNTKNYALQDVSFSIPKGKLTAIVGGSGSGKSTLLKLLLRLYDPDSGRITADCKDIRDFTLYSWRRNFGFVTQQPYLFNDTIENNIRYGEPAADFEKVKDAAEKANADKFISELENSYQTSIGDYGERLSGGQAQRIAIARAIMLQPDILVLDEATSSLDSISERVVQKTINDVSQNKTVIAVAHRLSTVFKADNIIVLENGRVVEQGIHEELLLHKGPYWKYVSLQTLEQDVET